jgi:hypothetical protein
MTVDGNLGSGTIFTMQQGEQDLHGALKQRIEGWLDDEGISFESTPDLNSHFHVKANLKNVEVHLSEPKVRKGILAVQAVVSLDEAQLARVQNLKPDEKAFCVSIPIL